MRFYCGIDVAKRKHAVVVLDERGQVHKPVFEIENTHAGMELLVNVLQQLGEPVLVGFESPDKLVAYAGIDATVHQSGQFQGTEMHMSKRGSPYLRLALWQAVSMCIQHKENRPYEVHRAKIPS